jgi:hypothetical protein
MRIRKTLSLLLGCVATLSPALAAAVTPAESLVEVNRALAGRTARIELDGGRIVPRASRVKLEPDFTDFRLDGRAERVRTEEVLRITALRERKMARSLVGGGVLGAAVGGIAASSSSRSRSSIGPSGSDTTAAGAALGAVAGLGIGALIGSLHTLPEATVYERASRPGAAARAQADGERNTRLKAMLRLGPQ